MDNFYAVWGSNENGQLEIPFKFPQTSVSTIPNVSGNLNILKGSVGYNHAVVFAEKFEGFTQNILTGWGNNDYGQITFSEGDSYRSYFYTDCEAGIETTYLLDSEGRIHGFGKDLIDSEVANETGVILNWNLYYNDDIWPQGYLFYPNNFARLSAGSGYLLATTTSGKITGWGTKSDIITGQVTGNLRSGIALNFTGILNSGSYVSVRLTGNWSGFRSVWTQSSNGVSFTGLNLYNNNIAYRSGLAIQDGGLGPATYNGYLDKDKNYLRVILTGRGSTPATSGSGILGVLITGYLGKNWQDESLVINHNTFNKINSIGNITDLSAGYGHGIVLFSGTTGLITGWGDNSFGQLNLDTNYMSGFKVSAGARNGHAIGLKNPIINRITGTSSLTLFYQGTGRNVTGLQVQRKSGDSTWSSPATFLRTGTAITNGLNRLSGLAHVESYNSIFYYRLEELISNGTRRTGAISSYKVSSSGFVLDDYTLYQWGGTGIYSGQITKFFPALGASDYGYVSGAGYNSNSGVEYLNNFPQLNSLVGNTSSSKKYYDIIIGDCHFFILDSDPVTGGDNRDGDIYANAGIGDPEYPYDPKSNYDYLITQQAWFNDAIANSTSKWKFVIFEHPVRSSNQEFYGEWDLNYTNGWLLNNADIVFNGLANSYERLYRYTFNKHVTYIVNGAGGYSLGSMNEIPSVFSQYRLTGKYGFTKLQVYDNSIITSFVDIDLTEYDAFTYPLGAIPNNLINTFAVIANYGVNGSSNITTVPPSYTAPNNNYYTYKVGQAITNSKIDAVFTAGGNSHPSGSPLLYPNNVNLTYSGRYFSGKILPKYESSLLLPTGIENVKVFDVDAGHKTTMVVTSAPLQVDQPTFAFIEPPPVLIPAPCVEIEYDS
jgi:alpha-tubulin suppressor-like RCC1 family protein